MSAFNSVHVGLFEWRVCGITESNVLQMFIEVFTCDNVCVAHINTAPCYLQCNSFYGI